MKNKILTKIALASAMLAGATGCGQHEHKNVVVDVKHVNCETIVMLRDVKTGQDRFFMGSHDKYNTYRELIGDTVNIVIGGFLTDRYYTDGRLLRNEGGDCSLRFDHKKLNERLMARKRQEEFAKMQQVFAREK